MTEFDKKIKELSRDMDIPASYDEKVDEILQSIAEKEEKPRKKNTGKWVFRVAVCLICIVCLLSVNVFSVEADLLHIFKQTIMDFLSSGTEGDVEEIGVDSNKIYVEGRPDLMLELQETVIDSHSIYLLVRITAPANITFAENVSFDYFCFCKGENYNNNQLLPGSRSCELLETSEERPNTATYVVSLVSDEDLEEGGQVTACFKDLTIDPYSDNPQLLVEGMWSVTFPLERTVTDNIIIEGNEDMTFPYINTTAVLEEIELTPFGIMVLSDVSNFPYDELGISDTTIAMKLKMIDGSELVIVSHNPNEGGFVQGGSRSFREEEGKSYQQDTLEFTNMIDINKVSGIYIEDLYVPASVFFPGSDMYK